MNQWMVESLTHKGTKHQSGPFYDRWSAEQVAVSLCQSSEVAQTIIREMPRPSKENKC